MRTCFALLFQLIISPMILLGQIDALASDYYETTIDNTIFRLPYYSNKTIDTDNTEVSKIIVVIHGTNRNADDYYISMEEALLQRSQLINQTLIIAPQFLIEEDIEAHNLTSEFPFWSSDGWKVGSNSKSSNTNPRSTVIPSYEILDSLILSLSRTFTSLDQIVFTGHSAGGQLTNRYTATTPIFSTLCTDYDISTKSIIANPGSYVYMSPKRRSGDNEEYSIPTNCAEYNDYSYGLEDLYTYHRRMGLEQIKRMYREREVIYLLGSLDNDPNASTLPRSCRAMLQGTHRLERGLNYYDHIIETFGQDIEQRHKLEIIEGIGHNNYDMYNHPVAIKYLFDIPASTICDQTTALEEIDYVNIQVNPNPAYNWIKITNNNIQIRTMSLYDLNGNLLTITNQNQMDISQYTPGTYFIRIATERSQLIKKIIVL